MKSLRVLAALYNEAYDHIEVVNECENDDGSIELGLHTFPPETLEWRAAIYDTDDLDELIDFVIYEPYTGDVRPLDLPIETATQLHREGIRQAKVRLRKPASTTKNGLRTTTDLLSSKGVDQKYIDAAQDDPYEVIKSNSAFDVEALEVKREFIARHRENVQQAKAAQRVRPSGAERAEALRAKLFRGERSDNSSRQKHSNTKAPAQTGELPPIILEGKKRK